MNLTKDTERAINKSKEILQKSLELFEFVNEAGKTFSFERERKIDKIKNELQLYVKNND